MYFSFLAWYYLYTSYELLPWLAQNNPMNGMQFSFSMWSFTATYVSVTVTLDELGGGFKYVLFSPRKLGNISYLTTIFFGWVAKNYHLVNGHGRLLEQSFIWSTFCRLYPGHLVQNFLVSDRMAARKLAKHCCRRKREAFPFLIYFCDILKNSW